MASLRPPSRLSRHPSRPVRRIFPFSLSLFLRTIAFAERRSADPPLAVRRIVTKGFAVIPDLICMLMVMDVYLLLFPGFVVARYPPLKSCLREWSDSLGGDAGGRLMFYQVEPRAHLSFKSGNEAER